MGIHEYPCPTCYSRQRIKAQSGEVVEIKDCDACAQTKTRLAEGDVTPEELDRYGKAAQGRRYTGGR